MGVVIVIMTNLFPTEHPPAVIDQFDVEVRPTTGKTKKPAPPVASKAAKKTTKPSSTKAKNPKPRPSLVADSASEASSSAESTDSSEESEADDEEDDEDAVASAAREQPRIFGKAGSPGTRLPPVAEKRFKPRVEHGESDSEMINAETRPRTAAPEYRMEVDLFTDDSVVIPSVGHRRNKSSSSVTSWSSGPGAGVPDSEYEEAPENEDAYEQEIEDNGNTAPWGEASEDEDPHAAKARAPKKPKITEGSEEEDSRPATAPVARKKPKKVQDSDDEDSPPVAAPVVKYRLQRPRRVQDSDEEDMAGAPAMPVKKKSRSAPPVEEEEGEYPTRKEPVRPIDAGKQGNSRQVEDQGKKTAILKAPKQCDEEIRKKPAKGKSVREERADQEKPHIRSIPVVEPKIKKEPSATTVTTMVNLPEERYHPSTRVVFPDLGKDIKLTDQTTEVRTVITDAIEVIKVQCILVDAYPVLRSKTGYAKTQMLKVARGKPEAVHIMQRLDSDPRFSRWLGNLATDRLSTVRSEAKKFAGIIVPGLYRFAHLEPASVKVLVEDLIENDKYIFPVIPITGQVDINSPYRHPAIIKLIKEGWFTGNFAARNAKYFTSSRPKKLDELEVPHPVPALAATAIYSALCEYQLTGTRQNIKFTENAYEDSYRHHQASLARSRNTAPTSTARVMHAIYKDVTAANVKTVLASTSMLINLVEVPDSD